MRYCRRFLAGIPHSKAGIHVLLTRPPLPQLPEGVRLACVRHAASVYPEPGSNSPSKLYMKSLYRDTHVLNCLVTSLSLLDRYLLLFLTTLQLFMYALMLSHLVAVRF